MFIPDNKETSTLTGLGLEYQVFFSFPVAMTEAI